MYSYKAMLVIILLLNERSKHFRFTVHIAGNFDYFQNVNVYLLQVNGFN